MALLLRNQRDRFLLDYYIAQNLPQPHSQATHNLLWRTVLNHVAYNNQRSDYDLWRVSFWDEDRAQQRLPQVPNDTDAIVDHLLQGYHNRPLHPVPRSPTSYRTYDPTSYDTMRPDFRPRQHLLRPSSPHDGLPSAFENRSWMLQQQYIVEPPPPQHEPIDVNYLSFRICHHMTPRQTAEIRRDIGPIYNLLTLYTQYRGPLPRYQSYRAVRVAITNILRNDQIRHNPTGTLDIQHNRPFTSAEFRCLLQALLGGVLQPSHYHGRMLPHQLINDLRYYVDRATERRFETAMREAHPQRTPLDIFWPVFGQIATGAYGDLSTHFDSISRYMENPESPDPAIQIRNTILLQQPHWYHHASVPAAWFTWYLHHQL